MKTLRIKTALRNTFFALATATMFASSVQAQSNNKLEGIKRERAIKSYIFNISHAKAGIRDASIKYAGEYKLAETTDALIDLLKRNQEPNTRILIANSLLMIGEEKGIEAIREVASSENDQLVKEALVKVINEFENSKKY
jgi:HEAT repeat protein